MMKYDELVVGLKKNWLNSERFQQLTEEDREKYGEPEIVFLDPVPGEEPASVIKRRNWLNWRAAPYPAERHSEYLFRADDLQSKHPCILLSAVLDVSAGFDMYIGQFNKKQRYQVRGRKAANAGFSTRIIQPAEFSSEIWDIIHSSEKRQGRIIAASYDSRPRDYNFPDYVALNDPYYQDICVGGFSPEGKMVAYILGKRVGEHVQYDEIMGHAEYVLSGVMFFTHDAFIREVLEQEKVPKCLNYGPWYSGTNAFSAQGGLNFWKRKTRFLPSYLTTVSS